MGRKTTSKYNRYTRPSPDLQQLQLIALRGVQAGREYFVTMVPLRLIHRLFLFDEGEIPALLRAQRTLNKARIPEIASYIVGNPRDYIFSSMTASVDGDLTFEAFADDGPKSKFGQLIIPLSARLIINDGQHRRAAIDEALKERPELGDETISVVIFQDSGLKRSQQMFADLNKHAVRPTRSIGVLYDHRDPLSELSRKLVQDVELFRATTEMEKTTISNRSSKLFTLHAIFQATKALLGKSGKHPKVTAKDQETAAAFWSEVAKNVHEWQLFLKKEISAAELRREYIHAHGVVLQALGQAGNTLLQQDPRGWKKRMEGLKKIDWSRGNVELWEGRAMSEGRVSKAKIHIVRTSVVIKEALGVELTEFEQEAEGSRRGAKVVT